MPDSNIDSLPVENVIKAYRLGHSTADIGTMYNVSSSAIYHLLIRNGVSPTERGVEGDDVESIIADYRCNTPIANIARKYETSQARVRRLLKEYQVDTGHSKHVDYNTLPVGAMINAYRHGKRMSEIATLYNLDASLVYRALRKHGITRNDWNSKHIKSRSGSTKDDATMLNNLAAIVDAYKGGDSLNALSRKFRLSPYKVKNALVNLGIYNAKV